MITAFSGDVPSTRPTGLVAMGFKAESVSFGDNEGEEEVFSARAGAVLKKFRSVRLDNVVVVLRFGIPVKSQHTSRRSHNVALNSFHAVPLWITIVYNEGQLINSAVKQLIR